jgi:hypothetical protein
MRGRIASIVSVALVLSCAKSGPSPEEQARLDAERDRKLQAEIEASIAPFRAVAEDFLRATSSGELERAYDLLAPGYTNMVPKESFVARVKTNKNFARALEVKVLRTQSQAGTTKARCVVGDLGLWEVTFASGGGQPKISGITIGGMPALPAPE